MNNTKLGTQGLTVPRIGLGCMGMSEFYGSADDAESLRTIDTAIGLGITFLDTADMYGPFTNEELVAKAIRGRRSSLTIATKFGIIRDPANPAKRGVNGRPEYVRQSCDASLKRLGTDYIDLYYQHRVDPNVPIEETVGAMSGLVTAGKVRYLGLSEAGPQTIRRAHAVHPISALQSEFSLWTRDPEAEILPEIRRLGIGFVAYSPLGRGFLTGRFRSPADLPPGDFRRTSPRFQGDNFARNLNLVDQVSVIAARMGITPGQVALAWVLSRGADIVPIPGTTKDAHCRENVAATKLKLSASDLQAIEAAFPWDAVSGLRYAEAGMNLLGR